MSNKFIAFLLSLSFFIIALITLPHYGINWDTINHLPRGQAYLHYFLTGKTDYSDLVLWTRYWQDPDALGIKSDIPKEVAIKRSLYQSDGTTFAWFMNHDGLGHPPLSDILSSLFNVVLFQKLQLINDIDAYRVYGVLLASCCVGLMFYWLAEKYGKISGIAASLALATYPLFWSESHFNNEKDIPETVYWSFLLFSVWKAVMKKSCKWFLVSGILFALALGTKFNVLFIPLVIFPWLIVYLVQSKFQQWKKLLILGILAILIGISLFIFSWPYLWPDPLAKILSVVSFYKNIGLTQSFNARFTGILGINYYPLVWVVTTTPPITLLFLSMGVFTAIKRFICKKDDLMILFLLWLIIPIGRVVWPGTTVYGGIRQIMEYIPAMAILAGLGAGALMDWISKYTSRKLSLILVVFSFIPILLTLHKIHPNENAYFNFLIGGLDSAKQYDLPSWGNTFGAAYRQGVSWINKNAEPGSSVVLNDGLMPNIPSFWFRKDINFTNSLRSGYLKKGEYAIGLVYEGTARRSYYETYLDQFIKPVYQAKVDGVSILNVWKNDDQHLLKKWSERSIAGVKFTRTKFGLLFDLNGTRKISRLEIKYWESNCSKLISGYTRFSADGQTWEDLPVVYPTGWKIPVIGEQPMNGFFIDPYTGQEVRFIELVLTPPSNCLTQIKSYRILELY